MKIDQKFRNELWLFVQEQKATVFKNNRLDKPRNGDSLDITFVLLIGFIMKTYLCYHLCPKSGLNYLGL